MQYMTYYFKIKWNVQEQQQQGEDDYEGGMDHHTKQPAVTSPPNAASEDGDHYVRHDGVAA